MQITDAAQSFQHFSKAPTCTMALKQDRVQI